MNTEEISTQTGSSEGKGPLIVYILYLAALLIGLTSIVGLIMAYVGKGSAPEWQKSHYQFQIRTFWIGLLYSVIGVVLCMILIGYLVLLFVLVWWIVRCAKGLMAFNEGKPVAKPTSWMFG